MEKISYSKKVCLLQVIKIRLIIIVNQQSIQRKLKNKKTISKNPKLKTLLLSHQMRQIQPTPTTLKKLVSSDDLYVFYWPPRVIHLMLLLAIIIIRHSPMHICAILALLITIAYPRIFETEFKFSLLGRNKGWIYLDKMTFAPGKAQVHFQTYTSGLPYGRNNQIFLQAIPESRWEKEQSDKCQNHMKMPLAIHQLTLDGSKTQSIFTYGIEEYQTFYFVLKDCQSRFINDHGNNNLSLHIKLHLLNNDREIGQEQDHWYIVPVIIGAGALLIYVYMNQYKNTIDVQWHKLLLFAGTVTQISSLCWKSFGFLIYSYTGSDYFLFHLIYLLLHSTSESMVVALVCLISFGWTLTFNGGNDFDLFVPVVGALGFVNIVITLVTKIGHSHDRHHIFDSIAGNILIGYRIIILIVFIWGCIRTYKLVRYNLKKFMVKFSILGLIYVASTPIIILVANYSIQAKNRNQFVFIAIQAIKFTTNLTLFYELNGKSSQYNKVNLSNASFIPQEQQGFK